MMSLNRPHWDVEHEIVDEKPRNCQEGRQFCVTFSKNFTKEGGGGRTLGGEWLE